MIRTCISRRDDIYACFPDIARAADGTLVCIYRECMMHAPFPFSRLVVWRRPGFTYSSLGFRACLAAQIREPTKWA
jgi:hypothetical protein